MNSTQLAFGLGIVLGLALGVVVCCLVQMVKDAIIND